MGWNAMREQIFANQKRLGVIPASTQLTPWPDALPKWETLPPDQKKLFARQAEVFAAYTAYTDYEIGRVIQEIQDEGKLDNTLIIYIDGDNGTSPEGTLLGTPNQYTSYNGFLQVPVEEQLKFYDVWGSSATYPHMAFRGPGPSTPRSNGPSRWHRTSAAPGRARQSPGRPASRTSEASARSSTT
jgi:arylsulfatase A-like enzyme